MVVTPQAGEGEEHDEEDQEESESSAHSADATLLRAGIAIGEKVRV